MKFPVSSIAVFLLTTAITLAAAPPWTDDWEAAKAKSKSENKPILIYMTGSDWCGWCKKLEKEVISKKAFTDFASQHFILMEADYPKTREQPAPLKQQNAELRKTYLNGGYPTVYVLDSEGKKLSKDLGELEGGVDGYIARLKKLLHQAEPRKK
jgi:protein disulfide-isomerase